MLTRIRQDVQAMGDPEKVEGKARFFKTGPGEYGQGDKFLGIPVPELRKYATRCRDLQISQIIELLSDEFHEIRFLALLLLVHAYKKAPADKKYFAVKAYLDNSQFVNNWDLVDVSCYDILGQYCALHGQDKQLVLCESKNFWERRIAIVSTYASIKKVKIEATFNVSEKLLPEQNEMVQKGIGWMLKEVYKRAPEQALAFITENQTLMAPLVLRVALEKAPKEVRAEMLASRRK